MRLASVLLATAALASSPACETLPNLALPTLGGRQLWSDRVWFAGWRIQQHAWTGHHRLLDPGDVRHAWGSREACRAALDAVRARESLAPPPEHVVVLLHGLGRSRHSLSSVGKALREADRTVVDVGYPSTRRTIEQHAEAVAGLLADLEGVRRVSFVTHSLGGIVLRSLAARAWPADLELGRVVMLAPPNRGSALARELRDQPLVRSLLGPALAELAVPPDLPPISAEVAIVAAGRGDRRGWNPFLDGDDDGVVAVDETRLEGAHAWWRVDGLHTFVMNDDEVLDAIVRFLDGQELAPTPAAATVASPARLPCGEASGPRTRRR